ncbi:transporter substrate-binding domain-containing protein, partial [Candidatus Babeliales bacterium]|nr:transporter substrate-binding domain-containing protein [Candidatus Babeliales bacterium]
KELKVMDLSELLFALDRKKIDLIVSGLTMTSGRKKRIDMIHYHGGGQKTVPVAFWKEVPAGVKTFDDIAKMGLSVVLESGSSWEDCAGVMGLTKIKGFAHYPEMVFEIKHGKSDAVLFDPDIVGLYLSKFPEIKIAQLPLNGKFEIFGLGIGVHKTTPKLRDEVTVVIKQMREDGTLSRLESKWRLN